MGGVSDPSRVRMSGPVVEFMDGVVGELQTLGYATTTSAGLMRLAAHLSRWLEAAGLDLADLTGSGEELQAGGDRRDLRRANVRRYSKRGCRDKGSLRRLKAEAKVLDLLPDDVLRPAEGLFQRQHLAKVLIRVGIG